MQVRDVSRGKTLKNGKSLSSFQGVCGLRGKRLLDVVSRSSPLSFKCPHTAAKSLARHLYSWCQ